MSGPHPSLFSSLTLVVKGLYRGLWLPFCATGELNTGGDVSGGKSRVGSGAGAKPAAGKEEV